MMEGKDLLQNPTGQCADFIAVWEAKSTVQEEEKKETCLLRTQWAADITTHFTSLLTQHLIRML